MIEEHKDLMEILNDVVIVGTLAGWTVKALKKLYQIFFKPGKHARK